MNKSGRTTLQSLGSSEELCLFEFSLLDSWLAPRKGGTKCDLTRGQVTKRQMTAVPEQFLVGSAKGGEPTMPHPAKKVACQL